MEIADNVDGNRLRFTVNREKGHVVSWSLHDRATRIMLAHSRGRSVIDGRKVAFDPNVERSARIMGAFFGDGIVEDALVRLIDADLIPTPPPAPRASAYRPSIDEMAVGTAPADVTPVSEKGSSGPDKLEAMADGTDGGPGQS